MTPEQIILGAVLPALDILGLKDTPQARVMMLAIGLQESKLMYRRQQNGPARGFWQFEQGGGVHGVLTHPASRSKANLLCFAREVAATDSGVYHRLEHDDVLAAGFARLLLLTDPTPLPSVTDIDGAWECYVRNWRPGKPRREHWNVNHSQARSAVLA